MTKEEAAEVWPVLKAYAEGQDVEIFCKVADQPQSYWHTTSEVKVRIDEGWNFPYRVKPLGSKGDQKMTNEEIKQELAELEANDSNVSHELVSAIYEKLDNDIDYTRVICKYNKKRITRTMKGYITDSLEEIKIRLAIHSEPDKIVDTWYTGHPLFMRFEIRGFDAKNEPVSGPFAYILDD